MPISTTFPTAAVTTQEEAEQCMTLATEILSALEAQDVPPCAVMVVLTVALQIMSAAMDATLKELNKRLEDAKAEQKEMKIVPLMRQKYDA